MIEGKIFKPKSIRLTKSEKKEGVISKNILHFQIGILEGTAGPYKFRMGHTGKQIIVSFDNPKFQPVTYSLEDIVIDALKISLKASEKK